MKMKITLKELFKRFLLNYLSRGNDIDDKAKEEIDRLTNEWFDCLDVDYFTSKAVRSYLDYLEHNVSDENLRLYDFEFNEFRYSDLIKNYILSG